MRKQTDSQGVSRRDIDSGGKSDRPSRGKSDRYVSSPEASRAKGLWERQPPGDKALA